MNEELQSTNEELRRSTTSSRSGRTSCTRRTRSSSRSSGRRGRRGALDLELRVTEWNDGLEELWGLRADEVVGQHFFNLDIGLPVEQLHAPLHACLVDGESAESS